MSQAILEDLLSEGRDLRDLARALGAACLDSIVELGEPEADGLSELAVSLQTAVEQIEVDWWSEPERREAGYLDLVSRGDVEALLASIAPPFAVLAVLRGVCAKPLTHFYARTWGRFELRRGDPIPLPKRRTDTAFDKVTPSPQTMRRRTLLGTDFRLYGGPANTSVVVTLDFSDRDNLDYATWIGDQMKGKLPAIASVHPYDGPEDLAIGEVTDDQFFYVAPDDWQPAEIMGQLRLAADSAQIAVMPELSLPEPDALGSEIAEAYDALPDLIVAGSAHADAEDPTAPEGRVRVNRGTVYLQGARLLTHDKIHEFATSYLGPAHSVRPRREDLTPRTGHITIAASTYTRLAVVICADLNDDEIPSLLQEVGVNLLLVPALTVEPGAFESACSTIASCQGVTVIVNGSPVEPPDAAASPFMVLVGVPTPTKQTYSVPEPSSGRRAVGLAQLGKPPLDFKWL